MKKILVTLASIHFVSILMLGIGPVLFGTLVFHITGSGNGAFVAGLIYMFSGLLSATYLDKVEKKKKGTERVGINSLKERIKLNK